MPRSDEEEVPNKEVDEEEDGDEEDRCAPKPNGKL